VFDGVKDGISCAAIQVAVKFRGTLQKSEDLDDKWPKRDIPTFRCMNDSLDKSLGYRMLRFVWQPSAGDARELYTHTRSIGILHK